MIAGSCKFTFIRLFHFFFSLQLSLHTYVYHDMLSQTQRLDHSFFRAAAGLEMTTASETGPVSPWCNLSFLQRMQVHNFMSVEYLPVIYPTPREKRENDHTAFAERVSQPCSRSCFNDGLFNCFLLWPVHGYAGQLSELPKSLIGPSVSLSLGRGDSQRSVELDQHHSIP